MESIIQRRKAARGGRQGRAAKCGPARRGRRGPAGGGAAGAAPLPYGGSAPMPQPRPPPGRCCRRPPGCRSRCFSSCRRRRRWERRGRCRSLFSVALLEVWITSPHPAPRRPGRPRGPQWDIQAPCAPPARLMPAPITSQKQPRSAGGGQAPRVVRQCRRCDGGEQRHRQRAQAGGQPDGLLLGRAKPRRETGTDPRRRRSTQGKKQHTGCENCRRFRRRLLNALALRIRDWWRIWCIP